MQAVVKKVVYSFRYRLGPGQVGREMFHIVLSPATNNMTCSSKCLKEPECNKREFSVKKRRLFSLFICSAQAWIYNACLRKYLIPVGVHA